MSVVALASAKGSPGTTLTALALASAWGEAVTVADVDPAGGDLVWRCRTSGGDPLDPDQGLLSLGAAVRRGAAETKLADHLQHSGNGTRVLVGVSSPEQLSGLGSAWSQIPAVLDAHDDDVLVDCGRIVPGSAAMPVLLKADVALFVVRPDLEGVAHLRDRLRALKGPLGLGEVTGTPVGVVVATSYRDARVSEDLQQLLDAEKLPATVLGIVAHDPKAARVLSAARMGDPRRTLLGRSAKELVGRIAELPAQTRSVGVG